MPLEARIAFTVLFGVAALLALLVNPEVDNRRPGGFFLANWVVRVALCRPDGTLRRFVKPGVVVMAAGTAVAVWFLG